MKAVVVRSGRVKMPADQPTKIEWEQLIVRADTATWVKDSWRTSPDGKPSKSFCDFPYGVSYGVAETPLPFRERAG